MGIKLMFRFKQNLKNENPKFSKLTIDQNLN
jgi:hypothetical protein